MKILVVTNMYLASNPAHPAQGVFVTEQVEALRDLRGGGIDVLVIKGFKGRFEYLKSFFRVVKLVKRRRYEIVHYHFGLSACSAPLVRLLTGAKIVTTFHGSDVMGSRWMRYISFAAAKFSHACICVSDEILAKLKGSSGNCLVIPCGVNEILFAEPIESRRCEGRQRIVVFPSSAKRREKDYPLFSEVVGQLTRIWGFCVEERHIDALDRREVSDLLQQADCLIMTSQREGSPQSVKEAMATNLPVISVDVGDVRTLLREVSPSMVIDDRDATKLACAAAEILLDIRRSNGRARLKELGYFSADIARRISDLYESIYGVPQGDVEGAPSMGVAH